MDFFSSDASLEEVGNRIFFVEMNFTGNVLYKVKIMELLSSCLRDD